MSDETAPTAEEKVTRTKNTTPITLLMSEDGENFRFIHLDVEEETVDEDGNVSTVAKTELATFENAAHAWKWVGSHGLNNCFYAAVRNYGTKCVAPVNRLRLV